MTAKNDTKDKPEATIITPPPHKHRMVKILISRSMALIIIVCILYVAFQIRYEILQLKSQTSTLSQQQSSIKTLSDSNSTILHTTQEELDRINKTLTTTLQEQGYQNDDWIILKARYYLELATINARWGDNIPTTLALLQQADTLLANLHEPGLFAVRQAIANDSAQINATPVVDITGILAQLDAVQEVAAKLEPKNPFKIAEEKALPSPTPTSTTTWRDRMHTTMDQLKKLVIIHHSDEALLPMLTPAYESVMRETIRLNLQEAQWAVLQHNDTVYQLALKQAINNINRTFDANASGVQALIKQLTVLQQTQLNIPKTMPDESLKLLNQFIESKHTLKNKNERPATGEPAL